MHPRGTSKLVVAALVGAALVLGAPAARAGDPKPVDACALLPKAEAERILGGPVKDAEHPLDGVGNFAITSCTYHTVSGGARISLIVMAATDPASAKASYEMDKSTNATHMQSQPRDVAGIGEAAFWTSGVAPSLRVLKGRVGLSVIVSGESGPDGKVRAVAEAAVKRLP